MSKIKLFSKRNSIARGWYWRLERDCQEDTANAWLEVFKADEPNVEFKLSYTTPK